MIAVCHRIVLEAPWLLLPIDGELIESPPHLALAGPSGDITGLPDTALEYSYERLASPHIPHVCQLRTQVRAQQQREAVEWRAREAKAATSWDTLSAPLYATLRRGEDGSLLCLTTGALGTVNGVSANQREAERLAAEVRRQLAEQRGGQDAPEVDEEQVWGTVRRILADAGPRHTRRKPDYSSIGLPTDITKPARPDMGVVSGYGTASSYTFGGQGISRAMTDTNTAANPGPGMYWLSRLRDDTHV